MPEAPTDAEVQMVGQLAARWSIGSILILFLFGGVLLYFVDEDKDELDECLLLSDADPADLDTYLRDDALFEFVTQIKTNAITLILDCSFNGVANNTSIKGFGESTGNEFDGVNVMKEGDVGGSILFLLSGKINITKSLTLSTNKNNAHDNSEKEFIRCKASDKIIIGEINKKVNTASHL